MKHIVLFSGGCSSAYAAKMVIDEHGRKNTILLHTPTFAEHEDADRFREEASDYLKMKIAVQADGRGLWQLIDDENCIPSTFIPFCTRILKQEQTDKFCKSLGKDFTLYYGFDVGETGRVQKQTARFEATGIKAKYPLFDNGVEGCEAKRIIRDEWKIVLPEPYKHLNHNNCLPCFKGGIGHFRKIWEHYPERFQMATDKENFIGHTVFKNRSLTEYEKRWSAGEQLSFKEQLEYDTNIPCMCAF